DFADFFRQAGSLLAEDENAFAGQGIGLQRDRAWKVVDPDQRKVVGFRPCHQGSRVGVVVDVLVAVGHHRAAPVPAAAPHNVDGTGSESVRGADHGPDVEVVLPVFDGHMEWVAPAVEVSDDRFPPPVAVPVHHVPAVAVFEQFRVVVIAFGPGTFPRTYTHLGPVGGRGTVGG